MHKIITALPALLRKATAVLCGLLFIITALAALLLFNIETRVFDAEIYKETMAQQNVYARLPGVVADAIVTSLNYTPCTANPIACQAEQHSPELQACLSETLGESAYRAIRQGRLPTQAEIERARPCLDRYGPLISQLRGESPPYLKNLTAADWEKIFQALFTPEDVQELGNRFLDQTFAYINGQSANASISTVELKRLLTGPAGLEALLQLMSAQADCTPEQVTQLAAQPIRPTEALPICNPPQEQMNAIKVNLQKALQSTADVIPNNVTFLEEETGPDAITREARAASVQLTRTMMGLAPLVPLGFLLGITLAAVRSLPGWLRWWGVPIFITGLVGIAMLWASQPLFGLAFAGLIVAQFPAYVSPTMIELIYDIAAGLLHSLIEPIVLQALILAILGLGMLVASYLVRPEHNQP